MFDPNSGFMYAIVAIVITFVLAQSVYFLVMAWKRGKAIGLSRSAMKSAAISSGIFTIAPAVAILLGVIALSRALGFPFPWLRLSVIGALTYETSAAATTSKALGVSLGTLITDPKTFTAIAWVMTIGIIPGPILVPTLGKRIENGVTKIGSKDKRWGEIFMTALFLGMISAFLGMIFATVRDGLTGWIPVFIMIVSALLMLVCGVLRKGLKAKWLDDYALPISMLGAMALSIPVTRLVESLV